MSDYISREAVKQFLRMEMKFSLEAMVADPEVIPSADVRPNIHGHWIKDNGYGLPYRCSICGSGGLKFWNFCRDCGADMREPKGEKGKI